MFGFFQKKKKKPAFLERYEQLCSIKIDGNTPIDSIRFVILDTETTSLDSANFSLLSFGGIAAKEMSLNLADSLEIVFRQPNADVEESAQIHGILQSHSEQGMEPRNALPRIIEFIGNSVLVGHHLDFDRKILDKTLQREYPGTKIMNKAIDTAELALRLEHFNDGYVHKPEDYSLDSLCQRYHITPSDRHTAAGDAFLTGQLFLKLLVNFSYFQS